MLVSITIARAYITSVEHFVDLYSPEQQGVLFSKCSLQASEKSQWGVTLHFLSACYLLPCPLPMSCSEGARMGCLCVPQLTGDTGNMLTRRQPIPTSFQDRIQHMMILTLHLLSYTLLCNQNLKASLWIYVKMQYWTLISVKVKIWRRGTTVKSVWKPQKWRVSWTTSAGYYVRLQQI